MTDIRITTTSESLVFATDGPIADVWNVGRSGELAPGVEVLTSFLPVQGYYESLVLAAPSDPVLRRTLAAWHHHSARYATRGEAQDGHAVLVAHIRTLVEAVQ